MTELLPRDDIPDDEDGLLDYVIGLVEQGRRAAATQANATLTMTYWLVGRAISINTLRSQRADYGKEILGALSHKLTARFGRGFDQTNLSRMMHFARLFPDIKILGTLCQELSWSHIRAILPLDSPDAREFYARQVVAEHLSVRELRGAIDRKAYERREIADSQVAPGTAVPMDMFRDPYLLDFLDMHDHYSEADLEEAIIRELEQFLLEFGRGFTFVERQKRIRFDDDDYYLDLLLYNRKLRRLVAVELKIGSFKPEYKGQMDFYLKWLDRYERQPGEEAPIGLLLVAKSNREVLELMEMHKDGIIVAEYWTEVLPRKDLQERLNEILRTAQERLARRDIATEIKVNKSKEQSE